MPAEENRTVTGERRAASRVGTASEDVPIAVEIGGSIHTGTYRVARGTLTVTFNDAEKSVPMRGMSVIILARQLLRELVREHGPE